MKSEGIITNTSSANTLDTSTSSASTSVTITGIVGLPEITPESNWPEVLFGQLDKQGLSPQHEDVLVVAQKVISKAEGRRVWLDSITPSRFAVQWGKQWDRDPRLVELVLRESARIIRMERGVIISETHSGYVCANAGIDLSNSGTSRSSALLLPKDCDQSACLLHAALLSRYPLDAVGVVIADSFGRPWRMGLTQVALGVAGFQPLLDLRGQCDAEQRPLHATAIAVADELACSADLVCGKLSRVPAALIRGATLQFMKVAAQDSTQGVQSSAQDAQGAQHSAQYSAQYRGAALLRSNTDDLFR